MSKEIVHFSIFNQNVFAYGFCLFPFGRDCIQITQRPNDNYYHPHIINAIIDCLGKNKDINGALNIYDKFCDKNEFMNNKLKLQTLLSCHINNKYEKRKLIANEMNYILRQKNNNNYTENMHKNELELMNISSSNIEHTKKLNFYE